MHAASAYDGSGAAKFGARWNSRNVAVAYAAQSRSLSLLEYLVHISRERAPADLVFVEAVVPERDITVLDPATLPREWRREPPPRALRALGDRWAGSCASLALLVPSVVVPEESNLMINPAHPRFAALTVLEPVPAALDPRLFPAGVSPRSTRDLAPRAASR
jgi:RES domain-containing protein